ncbi:MAG TPA: ABC transporter permease [Gaiellaceae bacterium]
MRVARYLVGRVIRGVLTLLTMIALTFALYFAIEKQPPMQFFFPSVGRGVPPTKQQVQLVRHLFYLDRSKLGLFVDYVSHLARGDFGHTLVLDAQPGHPARVLAGGGVGRPYLGDAGATLSILVGGAVIVLLLSLPLGAISGARVGAWRDRIISFFALVLLCTHPMMLGLILRSAGGRVNWLPTTGYCPLIGHSAPPSFTGFTGIALPSNGQPVHSCGGPAQWALHLLLPWLTFALLFLALYTRMVRASVAETIEEEFVRTARAKGASQARTLTHHVLPFAGLRVLTMVGMEIGTAIGVCIYLESVFGIPGLGSAAVQTLAGTQPFLILPVALAIVVLLTLIVVVGNLVVDFLYAFLDPRVGIQRGSQRRTKALVGGVF